MVRASEREVASAMSVLTRIEGVAPIDSDMAVGLHPGTNVRTPCGLRRVENLRPGDLIVTRRDGLQPIRVVVKRTLAATEIAADPSLAPVVLRPRALGPMMPQTEIRIASAHRILVPGYRLEGVPDTEACLIRARDLVGISDDAWVDRTSRETTFYSLVFDEPQVFAANGLSVESFMVTPKSVSHLDDSVREELERAVPDIGQDGTGYPSSTYPVWEEDINFSA